MSTTPSETARGAGRAGVRGRDPDRRRAILDAADAVIRSEGPEASMAAIADAAGISKPILYRHFGDKSGLYRALARRHVDALIARVRDRLYRPERAGERARSAIGAYLDMIRADLNLYRFLMHRATAEDPRTRGDVGMMVRRLAEELAEALCTEGRIADPLRARITAHAVIGMVREAGEWWLDHPEVGASAVADDLAAACVGAIDAADR